ncbi:hypothetical protein [Kamptonema formosum]|uniref:hypothetical protein n=1 Tax=Kamptonema formosum TaxID=331992 RepID=UPI00034CADFB|nr:hypothetical protein [Oscillatoria sp. PCC 10802]
MAPALQLRSAGKHSSVSAFASWLLVDCLNSDGDISAAVRQEIEDRLRIACFPKFRQPVCMLPPPAPLAGQASRNTDTRYYIWIRIKTDYFILIRSLAVSCGLGLATAHQLLPPAV